MNAKMTFLNGILEMEMYMYIGQLKSFIQKGKEDLMCKLKKTLYGFKRWLRTWYHLIDSLFINKGFCRSQVDHLLYVKQMGEY